MLRALVASRVNARQVAGIRVGVGAIALLKGLSLLARPLGIGLGPGEGSVFPDWLLPVAIGWIVVSTLLIVGWRPRVAAALLLGMGLLLLLGEQGAMYKNHLYLLTSILLLVAMSDDGGHFRLGPAARTRAARASAARAGASAAASAAGAPPAERVPGWPLFLMACQFSIVYGMSAIAKVNEDFLSGLALSLHMRAGLFPIPESILGSAMVLVPLSVGVVLAEGWAALAAWRPRWRDSAFLLLPPLHFGMLLVAAAPLTVFDIGLFALMMFLLAMAFVLLPPRGFLIVWDDSCSFCRTSIDAVRRADLFGVFRFAGLSDPREYAETGVTPEDAIEAMHLVEPGGRVLRGYDAVCGIVRCLPGGHIVAPFMGLPGVRAAGRLGYGWVAGRRSCRYQGAPPEVEVR